MTRSGSCEEPPRANSREAIQKAVAAEPWEYVDANTRHLTHNIHRYSGKFIPQVAARAIKILTSPGELVVDPYCGSGTTLVEAALLRRRALGVDLNPLAVLISSCKTTPIPIALLDQVQQEFGELAAAVRNRDGGTLFEPDEELKAILVRASEDPRRVDPWFSKWFQPQVLEDLIAFDLAIEQLQDKRLRTLTRVAFSDVLRRSSNAHSGYPNVMFDKKAPPRKRPGASFLKALERVCEKIATLSGANVDWATVSVIRGCATCQGLADSSADAVVTHPPYIGSIPYAEYGLLSLKWLGEDPKALDRDLTGGRRQSSDVVQRFEQDYAQMLRESHRILKPGRHLFVMIGSPVVKGKVVDLPELSLKLAAQVGFEKAAIAIRRGVNRRANKMGEESLLFLEKT